MCAKSRADALVILESVAENGSMLSRIAMSLAVYSSESLSLMIMGDSTSLFRKTYLSPEDRGLSSTGGRVGFSNSGSSRVSSSLSSLSSKSSASLSRVDSGVEH